MQVCRGFEFAIVTGPQILSSTGDAWVSIPDVRCVCCSPAFFRSRLNPLLREITFCPQERSVRQSADARGQQQCPNSPDDAGQAGHGRRIRSTRIHFAFGGAPTATTHHHPHSEMCLRREGIIELAVNGKSYRLAPGSVGFGSGLFGRTKSTESGMLAQRQPCTLSSPSDQARSCRSRLRRAFTDLTTRVP